MAKKYILNDSEIPPGGWSWVEPITGKKFDRGYSSWVDLRTHIMSFYAQNPTMTPPLHLHVEVMDWICKTRRLIGTRCHPISIKTEEELQKTRPRRPKPETQEELPENSMEKRGVGEWVSGAISLLRLKRGDVELVAESVARERSAVCSNCKQNVDGSNPGDTLAMSEIEARGLPTKFPGMKTHCGVCTCPLGYKVWFDKGYVTKNMLKKHRKAIIERVNGNLGKDGKNLTQCWMTQK